MSPASLPHPCVHYKSVSLHSALFMCVLSVCTYNIYSIQIVCCHIQLSSRVFSGLNPCVFRASILSNELWPFPSIPIFIRWLLLSLSLHSLDINSFTNLWLANIFSHLGGDLFLFAISFAVKRAFGLMQAICPLSLFYHLCSRAHILKQIFAAGCRVSCLQFQLLGNRGRMANSRVTWPT